MASIFRSKSIKGKAFECAIAFGALAAVAIFLLNPFAKQLPAGYEKILERGTIQAISEPSFVSSNEAQIADDRYILGVVIEGTPTAYSLTLLNSHEVINDQVGNTHYAAVW